MNIFYLHTNARKAAMMHCDKHCVKMILETAQMLCTAHRVLDGDARGDKLGLYRSVHQKHPSTLWVRASMSNYLWAYDLYMFLCQEFLARYGKQHSRECALHTSTTMYAVSIQTSLYRHCLPTVLHRREGLLRTMEELQCAGLVGSTESLRCGPERQAQTWCVTQRIGGVCFGKESNE